MTERTLSISAQRRNRLSAGRLQLCERWEKSYEEKTAVPCRDVLLDRRMARVAVVPQEFRKAERRLRTK